MNQFHQFATYFAVVIGSLCVIGVCIYAAIRSFRNQMHTAGVRFLIVIPTWIAAHVPMSLVLWVIATPNPRTPTNPAEYAVAPVYLAIAGLVCYFQLRKVKTITRSASESTDQALS
ncbi:MAG: hypothetical protein ACR2QT_04750 [Woeseiaceae bacterium]